MEGGFRKLFARRKSAARVEPSTESFRATSEYGSLPSGAEPQIGHYSIKPSENKQQNFGHSRTKSIGSQSITRLASYGQTRQRSRSNSISSTHANRQEIAAHGYCSNLLTAGATSPDLSDIPPVPKIPSSLYDQGRTGRKPARYVDLIHAVGAQEGYPWAVPSVSDPYSTDVADRNSAQNIELSNAAKRRSLMKYAEDVADRNISSPDPQRQSYESMRASRMGLREGTPTSPKLQGPSKRNVYSSAGLYSSWTGNDQQPEDPILASVVTPVAPESNQSPTRSFSRVQMPDGSVVPQSAESYIPGQSEQGQPVKVNEGQSATDKESRVPSRPQQPELGSTREFHRRFPSDHHRAHSSVTSVDSVGSLPLSTRSGRGHRRGMGSDMGSGLSSNISEMDDLDDEIAEAVPGKADPVQILRASMVGADGYIYKPGQSPIVGITEFTIEKPGTYPSDLHAAKDEPASAINQRAAEAFQKQRMAGSKPATRREAQNATTESIAKPQAGRKAPPPMPTFDLQGQFRDLKTQDEEVNTPDTAIYHVFKTPSDSTADLQDPEAKASSSRTRSGPSNQTDHSAGRDVSADPVIRDFAAKPTASAASLDSQLPYPAPARHDMQDDSAEPPTITRHREDVSDRSSRNSNRRSGDFSRLVSVGRSRNTSPSKPVSREPSVSHTLRATIDDETEASAPDQGYSIEAIEQKRNRSMTLAALARTPINDQTLLDDSTSSDFDRLKEHLANFKAALPAARSRGNSLRSDIAGAAASPTRARFNNGGRTQRQPPLRQYQHLSSSSLDDGVTSGDNEDFVSARSSFDPLARGRPSSKLAEAADTIDGAMRPSTPKHDNSAIAAIEPSSPSRSLPDPMNLATQYQYSRRNSNLSTLSASTTASSIPYDRVPPRFSSRRKYAHHKNGFDGDYFGTDAVESESKRSSLVGGIVEGDLGVMSDILSNAGTPQDEYLAGRNTADGDREGRERSTRGQGGLLLQGARLYRSNGTVDR